MKQQSTRLSISVLLHKDERTTVNDRAIQIELAKDVEAALKAELQEHGLGTEGAYYVDDITAYPDPIAPEYTGQDVDAILCVFDELMDNLIWASNKRKFKASDASADKKAFALWVSDFQQDYGTPGLRTLAMNVGKVVESIWLELQGHGLCEHWDGAWDFEYIPEVLLAAWLPEKTIPDFDEHDIWVAASLAALGYESRELSLAIKENVIRDYPELGQQLLHISNTYRDILDRVGADVLSAYTTEPSSTLADELNALSRAFTK